MMLKQAITKSRFIVPCLLFYFSVLVYGLSSRGEGRHWNYFVLLADAFLHGRLYLTDNPPWLNELIPLHSVYYVPYPPMPAILLMPFVAIFGTTIEQPFFSITIAALSSVLAYLVFLKAFRNKSQAIWLGILYSFGTILWYHAEVGSVWYFAHTIALAFIWLALLETFTTKRFFVVGLLIGCAFLARLPTIFVAAFPLIYCYTDFFSHKKIQKHTVPFPKIKNLFLYGIGLSIGVGTYLLYNLVRFGTVDNIGYSLIPGVLSEPWYRYGVMSYHYIPEHIKDMLWTFPRVKNQWPYIFPNLWAMAIWVTTPAYLLISFAKWRSRLALASAITALLIAIPILMHGSTGFTQFGFRFSLDFTPFLLLLVGSAITDRTRVCFRILTIVSIIINLWGVVMLTRLNLYSW